MRSQRGFYDIICVCQDPGGLKSVLPVFDALVKLGQQPLLVGCGYAATNPAARAEIESREGVFLEHAQEVLSRFGKPRLIASSIDSEDGGVGRALVTRLKGQATTVAIHDNWINFPEGWDNAIEARPDFVIVNDEIGAKTFQRRWDMAPETTLVCGFPALDRLVGIDTKAAEERVRDFFKLNKPWPLVFPAAQLKSLGEFTKMCLKALEAAKDYPCYVIKRGHPRMSVDAAGEVEPFNEAFATFRNGKVVDASAYASSDDLAAASKLVFGVTTSILLEKTVMRTGVAINLLTSRGERMILEESKGLFRQHPLVTLGCIPGASTQDELDMYTDAALSDGLDPNYEQARHEKLRLDGKNAQRAAEAIQRLLS